MSAGARSGHCTAGDVIAGLATVFENPKSFLLFLEDGIVANAFVRATYRVLPRSVPDGLIVGG
jgi:hypothetical protein